MAKAATKTLPSRRVIDKEQKPRRGRRSSLDPDTLAFWQNEINDKRNAGPNDVLEYENVEDVGKMVNRLRNAFPNVKWSTANVDKETGIGNLYIDEVTDDYSDESYQEAS